MVVALIPITFTDTSTWSISSEWNFGDGTPAVKGKSVSHTYNTAGTYRVTLRIISSIGKSISCFQDLVVTPPTTGTLNISSVPLGAKIFIDNIDQAKVTPHVIKNIPSGTHQLRLTLTGYDDYVTAFTITGGATTTLNPTLIRSMVCSFDYSQP